MTSKFLGFLLVGLFLDSPAAHGQVCFQDVPSFEAVKSSLPPALQSLPLYAIHQSFEMDGGFEIVEDGIQFEIEAHVQPLVGSAVNDSATITEACLTGDQLQVTLSTGTSETITVNSSSFTIENFQFDITDEATYESVVSKIN